MTTDQRRQEGKCKNTPIQLVIALLETSGFFCVVLAMDGRHEQGWDPTALPAAPAGFPADLPQQLLFAQFATPGGLKRLRNPTAA